jgi:hypothetical protein
VTETAFIPDRITLPSGLAFDALEHRYWLDDRPVPSVTQVLAGAGLVDYTFCREWARERGSLVHKAIAIELREGLDWTTVPEEFHPYISAELQAIADLGAEVVESEKLLVSKLHGCAGTLDRVLRVNGDFWLWDTKTGPIVPAYALQTAAYAQMYEEETGVRIKRRYALRVNANGTYELIPFTDRQDIVNFHAALRVVQWKQNRGMVAA